MDARIAINSMLVSLALTASPTAGAVSCQVEKITEVPPGLAQRYVAINYDGTRIAFSSEASLDPNNPNLFGDDQIVVYDSDDGSFTQLTVNSVGFDIFPHLDNAGQKVVWQGPGTPNSLYDIYFYDFAGGGVRRLTHSDLDAERPEISRDGGTISS